MKAHSANLWFPVFLAAAVVFGDGEFCRRVAAQSAVPGGIDPATGRPATPGKPAASGPATGPRFIPNSLAQIDPLTGLPARAPRANSAPSEPAAAGASSLLQRARELQDQGRFEATLQCYLTYYSQTRTSATNGPLASALPDWVELGQRYPKAKQALYEIRDNDIREFVEGRGRQDLFSELAEINAALGEKESSYALFLGIEQADPPLARECYLFLESALVERGEYELCARYLDNPLARFEIVRHSFEMSQAIARDLAELSQRTDRRLEGTARANGPPLPQLPANRAIEPHDQGFDRHLCPHRDPVARDPGRHWTSGRSGENPRSSPGGP